MGRRNDRHQRARGRAGQGQIRRRSRRTRHRHLGTRAAARGRRSARPGRRKTETVLSTAQILWGKTKNRRRRAGGRTAADRRRAHRAPRRVRTVHAGRSPLRGGRMRCGQGTRTVVPGTTRTCDSLANRQGRHGPGRCQRSGTATRPHQRGAGRTNPPTRDPDLEALNGRSPKAPCAEHRRQRSNGQGRPSSGRARPPGRQPEPPCAHGDEPLKQQLRRLRQDSSSGRPEMNHGTRPRLTSTASPPRPRGDGARLVGATTSRHKRLRQGQPQRLTTPPEHRTTMTQDPK